MLDKHPQRRLHLFQGLADLRIAAWLRQGGSVDVVRLAFHPYTRRAVAPTSQSAPSSPARPRRELALLGSRGLNYGSSRNLHGPSGYSVENPRCRSPNPQSPPRAGRPGRAGCCGVEWRPRSCSARARCRSLALRAWPTRANRLPHPLHTRSFVWFWRPWRSASTSCSGARERPSPGPSWVQPWRFRSRSRCPSPSSGCLSKSPAKEPPWDTGQVAQRSPDASPLELTRRSFEAAGSGDYDLMMSFYGRDSVFDMSAWGLGIHAGQKAIRTFFEQWIGAFADFEMELEEARDLGGGVVFAVAVQSARSAGSRSYLQLRHAAIACGKRSGSAGHQLPRHRRSAGAGRDDRDVGQLGTTSRRGRSGVSLGAFRAPLRAPARAMGTTPA